MVSVCGHSEHRAHIPSTCGDWLAEETNMRGQRAVFAVFCVNASTHMVGVCTPRFNTIHQLEFVSTPNLSLK